MPPPTNQPGNLFIARDFIPLRPHQLLGGTLQTTIDAGGQLTMGISAEIVNAKVSASQTSGLQLSLDHFTNPAGNVAQNASHIEWIDRDASFQNPSIFWIENGDETIRST